MAGETNTGPVAAVEGASAETKKPTAKKQRSPRRQKASAEPARDSKPTAVKRRKYSEQEKAEKLKQIETNRSEGDSTLKDAVRSAGITEQTYYQWKRAAKPAVQKKDKPVSTGDELADLVQLEEENRRLRKRLAKKLREENFELRKRLGLD